MTSLQQSVKTRIRCGMLNASLSMRMAVRGRRRPFVIQFATRNWGDAINRHLVHAITGRQAWCLDPYAHESHIKNNENVVMVGSTLQFCSSRTTVWGAGLISKGRLVNEKPKRVEAVRGPLTRRRLLDMGIPCPEIFGDPAILLPTLWNITKAQQASVIGFIPHYIDSENAVMKKFLRSNPEATKISIRQPAKSFLRTVSSCSAVFSSSLHGIIAAECLGIPALWIDLSGKLVGGEFKFLDYFEGSGRFGVIPHKLSFDDSLTKLLDLAFEVPRPVYDMSLLASSCPLECSSGFRASFERR